MELEPWQLPSVQDHLDEWLKVADQRVLDVGCGDGRLVRRLHDRGAAAVGLEYGAEMLRRAVEADPSHIERYVEGAGQDLPFSDGSFDHVVFSFSLHHVPADVMADALAEAARVLRPGGVVHVIEPVAQGLGHDVDALVDDETLVRALAQDAVDRAVNETVGQGSSQACTMGTPYNDFVHYENLLVGIDPERAKVLADNRSTVEAAFYANAIEHGGQWWFEDYLLARTLVRR